MKNPFRKQALTDEQIEKLIKRYGLGVPKAMNGEEKWTFSKEQEELFTDSLQELMKAKIDLQIEKEKLEEQRKIFEMLQKRNQKGKLVVGVCAMFAILILVPMTSQSAKGWLHNVSLEIFPEEDKVMVFPEEMENMTGEEDEAWAYIKDAIQAKRMYFPHMGDEWVMDKAVYHGPQRIRITYKLYGEVVEVQVASRNGEDMDAIATSGGSCIDEQIFVGDKDSRVRIYAYESEEGIPRCGAEIVYKNTLYTMRTSVEYDEFQTLVKGIVFEE